MGQNKKFFRNSETLYPVANDLTAGDSLPDGDEVARYCSPSCYDLEQGEPSVSAFIKEKTQKDISVNRLQYYQDQDQAGAVECIRLEVREYLTLKPKGRFVVFNVAEAKAAVKREGFDISIIYTPTQQPPSPSHSSIILPTDYDNEVKLATAIVRLITQANTYLAVP